MGFAGLHYYSGCYDDVVKFKVMMPTTNATKQTRSGSVKNVVDAAKRVLTFLLCLRLGYGAFRFFFRVLLPTHLDLIEHLCHCLASY